MSVGLISCPTCGARQSDAHRFCSECGALLRVEGGVDATGPMPLPGDFDTAEWKHAAVNEPALAVLSGGPSGAVFSIPEGTVTIGRSPSSDVFLDDVTVSRQHANVERRGDHVVLQDLGSLNGTYVNRRRIDGGEALENGDELQIGKFRLTYFSG